MFGVIICSKCSRVQGADLKSAHVTCPRCRARIDTKKAKVYFSTDSPKELAEAVRQISEQVDYNIEKPPEKPCKRIRVKKLKQKPDDESEIRAALQKIQEKNETISRADIKKFMQLKSEQDVDKIISKLLTTGIIFETSPDEFKLV